MNYEQHLWKTIKFSERGNAFDLTYKPNAEN